MISADAQDRYPFMLTEAPRVEGLRIRLDDIYPTDGEAFKLRLKTWMGARVGDVLKRLAVEARQHPKAFGP